MLTQRSNPGVVGIFLLCNFKTRQLLIFFFYTYKLEEFAFSVIFIPTVPLHIRSLFNFWGC